MNQVIEVTACAKCNKINTLKTLISIDGVEHCEKCYNLLLENASPIEYYLLLELGKRNE